MDGTASAPPVIEGVRRHRVTARGVDFHVTEAGDPGGRPVLALHGWPHHHWTYRDLLADPPTGLRIIAPDLPGYGWSGPAPHQWRKSDVALDVLALMDELGLSRVLLVSHDWGGFIGYLLTLDHPERIEGYLTMGAPHPWNSGRSTLLSSFRYAHMPLNAVAGDWLMRRTSFLDGVLFRIGSHGGSPDDLRVYSARFRDPVCAAATRDTYRTFVREEFPALVRRGPDPRSTEVPIRCLLGDKDIVSVSSVAPETARASSYRLRTVPGVGHFVADEVPQAVREELRALAAETAGA